MKSMLTKTAHLAALAAIMAAFSACSMFQSEARPDYQRLTLEKQIADANKKIDEIYHRVSVLQFMVDNHQRTLDDLKRNLKTAGENPAAKPLQEATIEEKPAAAPAGAAASAPAPPLRRASAKTPSAKNPGGAETTYHQAMAAFKARDYSRALALFTTVVETYPRHALADNALYWSGECHYGKKEYAKALETFQSLVARYPKGRKVPGALLKAGYACLELKDVSRGKAYLKQVISQYPFSPEATKAEAKLKTLM